MSMTLRRSLLLLLCALLLWPSLSTAAKRRGFAPRHTQPKYAPNLDFRPHHLVLRLTILPKQKSVAGIASLTLSARMKARQEVTLHAAELDIQQVVVGQRPVAFRQSGQKLFVELPKAAVVGKKFTVHIRYKAKPRAGLYFVLPTKSQPNKPVAVFSQGETHENRYWYPSWDYPNARFTTETYFTTNSEYRVISNGRFLGKSIDKKKKLTTWHHKMGFPHVNYLVSVVIGKFHLFKQQWGGIPVLSYVPLKDKEKAKRSFENTADMLKFFSEKIGYKYPYAKYAQVVVHDFMFGGMENITATTLTHTTLHDARAHQDVRSDNLVAHELAHQWFGDLLTCRDWSHLWLNEGFATYFAQLYTEHRFGKQEFTYSRNRSKGWYFWQARAQYKRPIQTKKYVHADDTFDSHAYPKGAAVLHMIRRRVGDRLWWKSIGYYVRKHAHKVVETSDLRKALEKVTGLNWEPFFDQWIRRKGHPIVSVRWKYNRKNKQVTVTLRQKQKEKPFAFDVKVGIANQKTVLVKTFRVNRRKHSFVVPFAKRPYFVELDAKGDLLMQVRSKQSVQAWQVQAQRGTGLQSRGRALKKLGKYPNQSESFRILKAAVFQKTLFHSLRRAAAGALGQLRTRKACKVLLKAATSVKSSKVRSAVVGHLRHCASVKPLLVLAKRMNQDSSYFVRSAAVRSIAALRHKDSYRHVASALKQKGYHGTVASTALWSLVGFHKKAALPLLKASIAKSSYGRVRRSALMAYASLVQNLDTKKTGKVRRFLVKFLQGQDTRMQRAAIGALRLLGDARAVPALRRVARRAPLRRDRRRAKRAIRAIYRKQARKDSLGKLRRDVRALRKEQRKLRKQLRRLRKRPYIKK